MGGGGGEEAWFFETGSHFVNQIHSNPPASAKLSEEFSVLVLLISKTPPTFSKNVARATVLLCVTQESGMMTGSGQTKPRKNKGVRRLCRGTSVPSLCRQS